MEVSLGESDVVVPGVGRALVCADGSFPCIRGPARTSRSPTSPADPPPPVLVTNARGGAGAAQCPVDVTVLRGSIAQPGYPVTIAPGNSLPISLTNPRIPGGALDLLTISAKCTSTTNSDCTYSFASSRTPPP